MLPEDIILKPVLTEKGYDGIQETADAKTDRRHYGRKYTFIVAKNANKTQIKIAVEQMFGVKVDSRGWGATAVIPLPRRRRSSSLPRTASPSSSSTRYRKRRIATWQSRDINPPLPRAVR